MERGSEGEAAAVVRPLPQPPLQSWRGGTGVRLASSSRGRPPRQFIQSFGSSSVALRTDGACAPRTDCAERKDWLSIRSLFHTIGAPFHNENTFLPRADDGSFSS